MLLEPEHVLIVTMNALGTESRWRMRRQAGHRIDRTLMRRDHPAALVKDRFQLPTVGCHEGATYQIVPPCGFIATPEGILPAAKGSQEPSGGSVSSFLGPLGPERA